MEFDKESFDLAASEAQRELAEILKANPDMERAFITMQAWMKKNYMKAGLKRLARIIKDGAWK